MRQQIVLIGGIGPATHALMSMADLRRAATAAGLLDVRTLLATGNLLCRSDLATADLCLRVDGILAGFGVDRRAYALDAADLPGIAAANPFADAARDRPNHLLLHVMAGPAALPDWQGPERIAVWGRIAWIDYRDGIGQSKLTGPVLTRLLGQTGTARNMNTFTRLSKAAEGH